MNNGTPMLGKHNPRWPTGNAPETIRVPDAGSSAAALRVGTASIAASTAISKAASVGAWLTGLPRRAGSRLFAANDAEARWHGWQVTELAGGLARRYRDVRFMIRDELDPHGGRVEPGQPLIPGVPEAWDDHWNGQS